MVEYRIIRLWADRVRLVHMYLEHPGKWPDGIETNLNRWYSGKEAYWRERAGHWNGSAWDDRLDDEAAYRKWGQEPPHPLHAYQSTAEPPAEKVEALKAVAKMLVDGHLGKVGLPKAGRPKAIEGEPWVAKGISRRTWERRQAEAKLG
jgi:hypothetical protein